MTKLLRHTVHKCDCYQLYTNLYEGSFCQEELCMQTNLLGMISVDYDISTTNQISYVCHLLQEKLQYGGAAHQPFTGSMTAYYSDMGKVFYDILRLVHP